MANDNMRQITSSEFRIKYQVLTEPYEVTALNRVIGIWTPISPMSFSIADLNTPIKVDFRPVPKPRKKRL